jgi:hypothetical protein
VNKAPDLHLKVLWRETIMNKTLKNIFKTIKVDIGTQKLRWEKLCGKQHFNVMEKMFVSKICKFTRLKISKCMKQFNVIQRQQLVEQILTFSNKTTRGF